MPAPLNQTKWELYGHLSTIQKRIIVVNKMQLICYAKCMFKSACLIFVEHVEDEWGELGGISPREELLVDFLELLRSEEN